MNEVLMAEFTIEEIQKALFQMGPWKAPGPDGFPAAFYQKHWDTIHTEVQNAVMDILQGGAIPKGFHDTTLVLIPKVRNADHLTKFRPISLCNVVYKIVAKVLVNRLKQILPNIISLEQSAFIGGRTPHHW